MKKVLLLSLSLLLGFSAFAQKRASMAQQRVAKNDLVSAKMENKKVAFGKEATTPSAAAFAPKSDKSVVINRYEDIEDAELMWSFYDLQSNGWVSNRMTQFANGSVAVTATMSHQNNSSGGSDRGTGYNFYNGTGWDDQPETRVEDVRTGWPTIDKWGATGEILISHAPLRCWTREVAGEGEWQYMSELPYSPEGFPYNDDASWPRLATGGDNNNIIHVIADIQHSVSDDEVHHYQVYYRSEDGVNWTCQYSPLAQDNEEVDSFTADNYNIAANGHNVAIIYSDGLQSNLVMYKSTDDGMTWTRTDIWENPINGCDWETDSCSITTDTIFGPCNTSIVIDNNGIVHVAFSTWEWYHDALDNNVGYFIGRSVDGIYYWNDTQEAPIQSPDGNPYHAVRLWWPSEESGYVNMHNDSTKWIGFVPMYEGVQYDYNLQYYETDYWYKIRGAASAMPALCVDPQGNLACAYSAPCTARLSDGTPQYYLRSIYVSYRNVDEGYWHQCEDDLTDPDNDIMYEVGESFFTIAATNTVNPGEFWFGYQTDDHTGLFVGSGATQTTGSENFIHGVKVIANPEFVSVPENTQAQDVVYNIYPNPATENYIVVESAQKADATITIVNLVGQTVMKFNKSLNLGANTINIDLQSGIYFCTVSANGFDRTMKFVVK
jgi:hypothetical protein